MNDDEPVNFFTGLLWAIGAMALMYLIMVAACAGSLVLQYLFFGG